MNNKTNYTFVGLAVILGFVLIGFFLFWLLRPMEEEQIKRYVIYFNESVLGLNVNAPVKYRGIDVGKVEKIGINPNNTEQVRVVVSVKADTPIKTTTVAKLTSQGITGLSYINLSLGDKSAPLLKEIPKGEKYPVIRSVPSLFKSVQTSVGEVYVKVSKTLDNIDSVLQEKNRKELERTLKNSADITEKINKALDEKTILAFQKSMLNIQKLTARMEHSLESIDQLAKNSLTWENNISEALASVAKSYLDIQKSMEDIGDAFKRGDFDIKGISKEFMPALQQNLNSLENLLNEFSSTIREYQDSPRDILFQEREVKPAPGER